MGKAAFWEAVNRWEQDYASDWEPWDDDEDRRSRVDKALRLLEIEPEMGLARLLKEAESGSVFAMRWVAHLYGQRGGEAHRQLASEYLMKAVGAGSWQSVIPYASTLFKLGRHDLWPDVLEDGVEKGFVPAYFWLAWYRHKQKPSRKTAREHRHFLELAVTEGHLGAEMMLAQWTMRGKFGIRQMPQGLKMTADVFEKFRQGQAMLTTQNQG